MKRTAKPPMPPMPQFARTAARQGGRGLRMKPGQMNKTEAERARQLEELRECGAIIGWWFQPFRLRLAEDNAYYTVDFMTMRRDGLIELEEIKGHWEEAALVRIKVAASLFPFTFVALTKQAKRDGGGWDVRRFKGWTDDEEPELVEQQAGRDLTVRFTGEAAPK